MLCIGRYYDGDQILGIFNFSEHDKKARITGAEGEYVDLFTGHLFTEQEKAGLEIDVPAYGFYYLKKKFLSID